MNRPEQNINSLPSQTQLAGHLHWHGSNSLLLTGADRPLRQCTGGKVSCRSNSYGPPNCCPMPVSGSWFKMGKVPRLNVWASFLKWSSVHPVCLFRSLTQHGNQMMVQAVNTMSSHSERRRGNTSIITPLRWLWVNLLCCGNSYNSDPLCWSLLYLLGWVNRTLFYHCNFKV